MSYILDALRRSQAERERGQVPGLDAQPAVGSPTPPTGRRGATVWIGVGAGLGLGLLAAWLAISGLRTAAPPVVAVGPTPVPMPSAAAPPEAAPPPDAARLPVVVSAPPLFPLSPQRPPLPPAASLPMPTLPVPTTPAATPPDPRSDMAVRPVPASAAEPLPVPLAQLPPAQRRELPALAVGGVIWSENAASRFVIIDGQVVREGGSVAPGVTLERIERSAAILRWRGTRLRLSL